MHWSDPSGLAPEKEKKKDRILYTLLDMETWANVVNKIDAEYQAFMAYIDSELDGMKPTEEERGRYWKKWGGDRRGESNENAVNNGQRGIKVINKNDKETVIKSVEDYYEDLITFDENDLVTFKDNELASEVAKNDPKSNFAKLFTLATNLEELFVIEGVRYDQSLKDFQKGMSGNVVDYLKWSLKDICEKEYIVSTLTGQFLPSNNKGKINLLWSKDGLNNTYYCNQYQGFDIGGSLAHELYFHAYLFLLYKNESSLPFWHPTNYHMTQSSEYINALKKKK